MTKIFNFALKIKGGGREGGTCEVLRPCHPQKIWNVHQGDALTQPKKGVALTQSKRGCLDSIEKGGCLDSIEKGGCLDSIEKGMP